MSAVASNPLPKWDMTPFFPSLDSKEFQAAFDKAVDDIKLFEVQLNEHAKFAGQFSVAGFESLVGQYNELFEDVELLEGYLNAAVTTNSRDEKALAMLSEFEREMVLLSKLSTKFVAWLGSLPTDKLLADSEVAKAHEYALKKANVRSQHLMAAEEEALAAELNPTGASAWSRLHSNMTSQIEVDVDLPIGRSRMPMSAVRTLAYDNDREIRKAGYEAELAAWKAVEVPIAACMNGIKGQVNTLVKKRGWESALNEALFNQNIDRGTLDAMMTAAKESFPHFRRYLKAKAKGLGIEACEWYDIFAPFGEDTGGWTYEKGAEFVARQFTAYAPKMGEFARRTYAENWIDAEPRAGKVDGAYCMPMRKDESRILMNYKPSFGSIKTLAHELGHAYHGLCLKDRTAMQKHTPSTLAETASIFCETIVKNAALKEMNEQEQVSVLEATIQGCCQTVVDITSRFLFENAVFDARWKRELAASEFNELMLQAQKDTYGDGLASYHPYMWAVKPHYYSTYSFYNFPYMFGLLFGLGLYAQFEQDPDKFRGGYDDLLSSTGLADASTLAQRFGINITTPEFWRASLDVIRQDIDLFEARVNALADKPASLPLS